MFIFIQVQVELMMVLVMRLPTSSQEYPILAALPRGSGLIFGLIYYVNKSMNPIYHCTHNTCTHGKFNVLA